MSTKVTISAIEFSKLALRAGVIRGDYKGTLRAGQALFAADNDNLLPYPWPELFYESDEDKIYDILMTRVEVV